MAASYASTIFRGSSGRAYYKDTYLSDSAGAFATFDSGSGASATSDNKWIAPENGWITDFVIAAATGQTKTQVVVNGAATGDIFRNSIQLAATNFRPIVAVPIASGAAIQLVQLA